MIKQKSCKNCGISFQVEYELGNQASLNSCKRKYCSKQCAKVFNKKNKTSESKAECKCLKCGEVFFRAKSQSGTAKFCSAKCRSEAGKRFCTKCECEISPRIKDGICYPCRTAGKKQIRTCEICNKQTAYAPSRKNNKRFCSRDCQFTAQSNGMIVLSTQGRHGFRIDLNDGFYYKSSLEADFARFCKHMNFDYVYESKTFKLFIENKNVNYTPDFYLPQFDKYVEVKGNRKDKKYESNLRCVEFLRQQKIAIDVKMMTDFYNEIKHLNIKNIEGFNYNATRDLIQVRSNYKCRSTRPRGGD